MKHLSSVILAIALVACNTDHETSNPPKTETMEKHDKQQIEKLLEEYKTSLNTSNAELSTGLYAKDGVFMPSEAPSAHGKENIRKAYEFVFSQIQLNIEFFIEEITVQNNFAFATTTSKGSTFIRAIGQTVPEENRELFVFEKVDGEWKIARYMFNKMSPQK